MTALDLPGPSRPGFFRKLSIWWGPRPVSQVALIFGVIGLIWWFGANTAATLDRVGISPGFDFLGRSAPFEIGESMIPFSSGDTYARAVLVGLLNTIKVAILGCVLATLLGVTLGVARLSGNPLLAGLVRWYVEVIRNVPLLLQLFFWSALTHAFPPPRQAISAFDAIYLTSRGVYVPAISVEGGNDTALWCAGLLVVVGLALAIGFPPRLGTGGGGWVAAAGAAAR